MRSKAEEQRLAVIEQASFRRLSVARRIEQLAEVNEALLAELRKLAKDMRQVERGQMELADYPYLRSAGE